MIGIVGVPNSGKSTFFKALTLIEDVEIASYPFTTIKPNQGVAFVTHPCVCKELGVRCNPRNSKCINGIRFIPVKVMDVAGLVKGAHEGKGLGNQFLDDLRQADGLVQVVDISGHTDSEGRQGNGDPEEHIKILEEEIDYWVFGIIEKGLKRIERIAEAEKVPIERLLAQQLSGLGIKENEIKEAMKHADMGSMEFVSILRKVAKPIIIAANKIDILGAKDNYEKLRNKYKMIACSAESELALKEAAKHGLIEYIPGSSDFNILNESLLNESQKKALRFIKERVLKVYGSTGVQKVVDELVFSILNYIVVYPVANENKLADNKGNVLPDAFLVKKGTTVKELAEMIHSDIKEGFVTAIDARTKKRIAADYELRDGDIIRIMFK
ncbi:MAG TPA: redox-regulated ATPase YchF [Candidatus Aenigmarchaeota archaeon]|nr:MAG: redox-regulated ATPase YchF [Candidatus Aenigmarchaeota archaeon]HDD46293.1 redox-regulated ATPase YchF [Candidatus Aenigmarchaeota archaeon]